MNSEYLSQYLLQMGFDHNRAAEICENLLKQFASRGKSAEQALEIIIADLKTGGEISRQIDEMKSAIPTNTAPSSQPGICPNCGRSIPPEVSGMTRQGECAYCGIIFDKFKAAENPIKSVKPVQTDEKISKPAQPSGTGSFVSRHKWIVGGVVLWVIAALVLVHVVQSKRKQLYVESLARFDQQLKMETKEEFETSLNNLKLVIEDAAFRVSERGWSKSDVNWFCDEARKKLDRFAQMIDEKADGQKELFGFRIVEIEGNLCSGMHMILLSIRDEDVRLMALLNYSFAVDFKSPNFRADRPLAARAYISYNPGQYKASSQRKLVRDGKKYFILEKTEQEKKMENYFAEKGKNSHPQGVNILPSVKKELNGKEEENFQDEKNFRDAKHELQKMWFTYRRKNKQDCYDAREVLSSYQADGGTVSPITTELINNDMIALEKVDDKGTHVHVRDLRPKTQ